VIIGAVVCCAAAIAGDNMQDLKAGYIVRATPWKQQVMQIVGTLSAALVMAPILTLLLKAYGFAGHSSAKDGALSAVQANLVKSIAVGVFEGGLPWAFIAIGMGLAIIIIAADGYLASIHSRFRVPVLAVAIGIYLPFQLSVPIFAGGVIHEIVRRIRQKRNQGRDKAARNAGLLFASGLITGEALAGILIAIPIVAFGSKDILAVLDTPLGTWPAWILLGTIAAWLYRLGTRRKTD
jgi:putative OPT family oligopeptide transporter